MRNLPTIRTLALAAAIAAAALTGITVASAADDTLVWGPSRGHKLPQCPPYHPCPKPNIFY